MDNSYNIDNSIVLVVSNLGVNNLGVNNLGVNNLGVSNLGVNIDNRLDDDNDISTNAINTINTINSDQNNYNFRSSFLNYLNNLSNTVYDNAINNFIDSTLNTSKCKYKKIPNEIGLSKIQEILYSDISAETQNMCPIYCTPFNDTDIVCKLPCNHIFSKDGIYKWFNESHVCPVCRYELDYKEVKDKDETSEISNHDQEDINLNEDDTSRNNIVYYNRYPSFNLINLLIQQEEIQYQQAIIRSLSEN